jgi:signal transduction histidine kinase
VAQGTATMSRQTTVAPDEDCRRAARRSSHAQHCLNIEPDCVASVDGDRLEQVVSNILGNAVTHGDPAQVVTVDVLRREGTCGIEVHNYGSPIEPSFMPLLFDPFKRDKPCVGSNGLGLGLYISERIVAAHEGKIEVSSSAEAGTRFDICPPCAS